MRRLAAAVAACGALLVPASASAAPPLPFGHACDPQNGVLLCPTTTLDQRVASWDGVPIDVDVTLPPTGDGPFPTIVMAHGLGGTKTDFESADENGSKSTVYHYNNNFYAKRGYAVVNFTARGWGNSCGSPASRTSPGCDRGWTHLDDQAFEAHDVQYLLGLLADEGVTQPNAIGVTGISLGGGLTNTLAYLKNRVRTPDGALVPWKSPNGTPLHIAAAWARWGWADLGYALVPNGRFRDTSKWQLGQAIRPIGIEEKSFIDGFYLVTASNFVAPIGADANAAFTEAKNALDQGEPYGTGVQLAGSLLSSRKSAAGLFGSTPAPLLLENGWTDDIFPVTQALMIYNDTNHGTKGPVSLQFGDLGHGRGAVKANENQHFNDQGAAFFDAYLLKQGKAPAAGSVDVMTQTCPNTQPAAGPYTASSWAKIHPGTFRVAGGKKAQRVTSGGGDPAAAQLFDKVLGSDPCPTAAANKGTGTARYSNKIRKGFTMVGLPLVKATIKTKGKFGELAARLYDVSGGQERLITRGAYRLLDNQKGKIAFQLNGNAYKLAKGHTVELELLGQDPNHLRKSNGTFTVSVSKLSLSLPTRERKPS
ncbi:MAG TPA: CocE/NonD family hydrolase [Thermoleophilaceae bacterium]|nr:CocE/NonD family hydrolase [Thermoleophilaceae bacterium]